MVYHDDPPFDPPPPPQPSPADLGLVKDADADENRSNRLDDEAGDEDDDDL